MAVNLEALQKKLNQLSGQNSRKNTMWRPPEGEETTIRIIAFPDNDGQPFKERYFYYNIGNNPGLLAPYQFGKPDPFQELITKLRSDDTKESYELAKKLYPKMRSYAAVIVRGEEDKGVRLWGYGKMAYQELLNLVLNPEYGDITDVDEGTDLVIGYGKPPGAAFPRTTVTPRRRSSTLVEDRDEINKHLESIPDFSSVFDRKTPEQVQAMLDEFLLGDAEAEEVSSETKKYGGGSSDTKSVDEAFDELLS